MAAKILPTPKELVLLKEMIDKADKSVSGEWAKYKGMLQNFGMAILKLGAVQGVSIGAGQGLAAAGVHSGLAVGTTAGQFAAAGTTVTPLMVSLFPVTAAIGPWIGAAAIAARNGHINGLIDLRDDAKNTTYSPTRYHCQCGGCKDKLTYLVDKEQNNVAINATSLFLVGLPKIVDRVISVGKSFQKGRPKELACKHFVTAARGGCTVAAATIFYFVGSADKQETWCKAYSIMVASDGWEELKRLI